MPALQGGIVPDRYVAAEFLSEGLDPVFLLLKGRKKLFYSEVDPPLLFDLERDPHERHNPAEDEAGKDLLDDMLGRARATWDGAALKERIIKDQNRGG